MKELIKQEPLCIDAYAHLGIFYFNYAEDKNDLVKSRDYHKQAVAIALKSIGNRINDVFQWGFIENRPFLRSLVGMGLSLWRLNRFEDALYIMKLLVWLNPNDNQGARFLIHPIENKEEWSSEND